jgi:thymidylate synthase|tara:strand:- start:492 stop:1322 length:831 start_codon:yes stop_codon:yes gene_type:complete
VIGCGELKKTRNGATVSLFGQQMVFGLQNNSIPLLTTKKMAWKTCIKELLWFISGDTDNQTLTKKNVKIWNGNASEEFKKSRGLDYKNKGDLGPIYGHQWRHFNAEYKDCKTDYSNQGIDQLQNIINYLNDPEERFSRRLLMSSWNPCQLDEMVLPPCHVLTQFHVNKKNELSCMLYQRSGDVGLGIPFNMASYGILTCLLAQHTGLQPGKLIHNIGDAHIYENHIPELKNQILRDPHPSPILTINRRHMIDDYNLEDFQINNYKYHPSIYMPMIA